MVKITKEFVDSIKEKGRDSFKVAPTKIEMVTEEDFEKLGYIEVKTQEGNEKITLETLKSGNYPEGFRKHTNMEFNKETKQFDKPRMAKLKDGTKVEDSWFVDGSNHKELGYKKRPDGLYEKSVDTFIPAIEMNEEFEVTVSWSDEPLKGKPGDYLMVYGDNDYNAMDRQTFFETYRFKDMTIEDAKELKERTSLKTESKVEKDDLSIQ